VSELGRNLVPVQPTSENADPFDTQELRSILRAAEVSKYPEMALLFEVWMRTGMRAGEVLGLQEQDIDYASGLVTIGRSWSRSRLGPTKTGRTRTTSLLHPICEATGEWCSGTTSESRALLVKLRNRKVHGIGESFVFGGQR
jgi:integrase